MKETIDLKTWNRREHFDFFRVLENPFFSITADVDFTSVYLNAKKEKASFFLYSLHAIMYAANQVENFRYRIERDAVVCYDVIHPSSTIGREDGTFGFSFFEYIEDKETFIIKAKSEIERVKEGSGLMLSTETARQDTLHFSPLPWVRFTSLTTEASSNDSIPKITTGKCVEQSGRYLMPVAIAANHAVVDGYHIAQYFDRLNEYIASF